MWNWFKKLFGIGVEKGKEWIEDEDNQEKVKEKAEEIINDVFNKKDK